MFRPMICAADVILACGCLPEVPLPLLSTPLEQMAPDDNRKNLLRVPKTLA
jgi:hypothetical protein